MPATKSQKIEKKELADSPNHSQQTRLNTTSLLFIKIPGLEAPKANGWSNNLIFSSSFSQMAKPSIG